MEIQRVRYNSTITPDLHATIISSQSYSLVISWCMVIHHYTCFEIIPMFETENPSSVEREVRINSVFECKAGVIMGIHKEALTFKLYKIRRYMSKICWNAFLGCFHILNFFENLKNFEKIRHCLFLMMCKLKQETGL